MSKTEGFALFLILILTTAANAAADDRNGVPDDLASIISDASRRYDIDERLLVAVARRESDFRRRLVSRAGARGVMQLMPETAASLGVRNCFNPRQNIFGGAQYLKQLEEMFDGDLDLMLAAYNAGPGAVRKYGGIPPYRETRAYVKSIRHELRRSAVPLLADRQSDEAFFVGVGAKQNCARLLSYDRVQRDEDQ